MLNRGETLPVDLRGRFLYYVGPVEAVRDDAELVDFGVELDAELFGVGEGRAGFFALKEFVHIDGVHQRLFGHDHGFFGGAADADAEHSRRTPAGSHGGDGLDDPIDYGVGGVEHGELGLGLAAAALGGDGDVDRGACDQLDDDHGGGVVAGVLAGEGRVGEDTGAEEIVWVEPRLACALVDHLLHGHHAVGGGRAPLDFHANLDEGGDDAGVLADGTMALGAHAGVDEDLRDGVLGGVRLLVLVGACEVGDVIDRVIEADVLQRVGYGTDYVVLLDDGHKGPRIILWCGDGSRQSGYDAATWLLLAADAEDEAHLKA